MSKFVVTTAGLALAFAALALFNFSSSTTPVVAADEAKAPAPAAVPVEGDMHEFMEYVFEPTYKRLQQQMAVKEKDRAAWKQIKSDSLILAEAGTLTMMRGAKDSADWNEYCQKVRDLGGELYKAAKARDVAKAQQNYVAMIAQCNACHTKHAGGEHQLKP